MNKQIILPLVCLVFLSSVASAYEVFRIVPEASFTESSIAVDYWFTVDMSNYDYIYNGDIMPPYNESDLLRTILYLRTCIGANSTASGTIGYIIWWEYNSTTDVEIATDTFTYTTSEIDANTCALEYFNLTKDSYYTFKVRVLTESMEVSVLTPSKEVHQATPTIDMYYDIILTSIYKLIDKNVEIFEVIGLVIQYFAILMAIIIVPSIILRTILYLVKKMMQ